MPRKQYAMDGGKYLGWMDEPLKPEGAVECNSEPEFNDCRFIDGEWKRPESKFYVDAFGKPLGWYQGWELPASWNGAVAVAPPDHGLDSYNHQEQKWVPYAGKYAFKRQADYEKIGVGQQLDALYKFIVSNNLVQPDPTKPVDTPEGWLAKIQQIKAAHPKPQ